MRKYGLLVLTMGIMLCSACGSAKTDVPEQAETLGGGKIEQEETAVFLLPDAETAVRGEESVQAEGGQETKGGDDETAGQAQESEGTKASKEQTARRQLETSVSVEKAAAQRASSQPSASGRKDNVPVESPVQPHPTDQSDSASQAPEPEGTQEIGQKPENPKAPEPAKESEPVEIPESPEPPEPTNAPKPAVEKSIYDYEFDVSAIRSELIALGQSMGLTHITDDDGVPCTPDTCSWASPITASQSFQGDRLKGALQGYVTSMPSTIASYGGTQLTCFSIYVRDNGGGSYTFYFLY